MNVTSNLREIFRKIRNATLKLLEMDARFCYLILRQRNGGNAMAFGERLQEVRKRSGLTQEEFAEQLQVSRQSVSRWESGVSHS